MNCLSFFVLEFFCLLWILLQAILFLLFYCNRQKHLSLKSKKNHLIVHTISYYIHRQSFQWKVLALCVIHLELFFDHGVFSIWYVWIFLSIQICLIKLLYKYKFRIYIKIVSFNVEMTWYWYTVPPGDIFYVIVGSYIEFGFWFRNILQLTL